MVAISEETGAISYAYKGVLTRGVSHEELRSFLTSVLVRRSKPHTLVDGFRRWWGDRTVPRTSAVQKANTK